MEGRKYRKKEVQSKLGNRNMKTYKGGIKHREKSDGLA